MKERPISYKPDMVRARNAGNKTITRRALRIQPPDWDLNVFAAGQDHYFHEGSAAQPGRCWPAFGKGVPCPYGKPGDRLWVREAWRADSAYDAMPPRDIPPEAAVWYEANGRFQPVLGRYRPPMFMPRWASRGLDEITGVRVERLQDISEADAMAEGVDLVTKHAYQTTHSQSRQLLLSDPTARRAFERLWESINGPDSWAANPWVWVIAFKVVKK